MAPGRESGRRAVEEGDRRDAYLSTIDEEQPRGAHLPRINGERRSDGENFPHRVVSAAGSDLFTTLPNRSRTSIHNCEINLATLQRMNIHAIQRDLVRLTSEIIQSGQMEVNGRHDVVDSQAARVRELMKEYCTAWRDWDMILQSTSTADSDPFRITTHKELSAELMMEAGILSGPLFFDGKELPFHRRRPLDRNERSQLPGVSRHAKLDEEKVQDIIQRFCWGIGGGLALIGPMLLMVLYKTLLTTLLTTSVSVVVFAFAVAMISGGIIPGTKTLDLGPGDVLAATATYAAVLVVFVGASS